MLHLLRAPALSAALFLSFGISSATADADLPSPATAAYFQPADFTLPRLSPDGKKVCAIVRMGEGTETALVLIDLATNAKTILAQSPGLTVANFWWKGDTILFLINGSPGGRRFRSVNLATQRINDLNDLNRHDVVTFVHELPDDPHRLLFSWTRENTDRNDLVKVDLRNGKDEMVERDPVGVSIWFTNSKGEAVAALTRKRDLLWRPSSTENWRERIHGEGELPDIVPLGCAPDDRRMIVIDYRIEPTGCVGYFDFATEACETIAAARSHEPTYLFFWGHARNFAGVVYSDGVGSALTILPEAQPVMNWLGLALPKVQYDLPSFSADGQIAIVHAASEQNAGVYFVANLKSHTLTPLRVRHHRLNPKESAAVRHFQMKGRDGQIISGFVTLPRGVEHPPLILNVGPALAPTDLAPAYSHIDQFLASRGYATLTVRTRGTLGLGRTMELAGDFQATNGIVDDLSDALQWVLQQGWTDGQRVGLLLNERGALPGFELAARTGRLFKALAAFDAPADTSPFAAWVFATSSRGKKPLEAQIGGRSKVDGYADASSPLRRISKLSMPVFLVYNRYDFGRVPDDAGRMKSALKKAEIPYVLRITRSSQERERQKGFFWQDTAAHYEAAAGFFDQHLAASAVTNR